MAIEKVQIIDKIESLKNGFVQVRTKIAVVEDGIEISSNFHRHGIAPGADYSGEDGRVQAICAATHTPEVISAYKSSISIKGV